VCAYHACPSVLPHTCSLYVYLFHAPVCADDHPRLKPKRDETTRPKTPHSTLSRTRPDTHGGTAARMPAS